MRAVRRSVAALAAAALTYAGCAAAAADADRTLDLSLVGRLDKAVGDVMTAEKIPGALIGIWSPAGDYVRAFGVADTASGRPMTTGLYSRIGSVTKTFTATAVLQLVDAGAVRLDDPIARYVPGVPGGDAITVRRLLTMRSGLADYTKVDGFQQSVMSDPHRQFTPAELLDWAFRMPADFAPGEKFEYSNTNYVLLGLLVEKVGGTPIADYLNSHILVPLRMAHTGFPTDTQLPNPHAQGYTEPEGDSGVPVDATDWTASFTWAAGAMTSTLDDMRIWLPALASGTLLSPELQAQRLMTPPEAGGPTGFGYGMGVFTLDGWVGHNGSVPGYQTVAVYLPERATTLVVMINTDIAPPGSSGPGDALAQAVTSVLTPDHIYAL